MPAKNIELLKKRGIDISGLQIADKTFRWQGYYEYDMNDAKTIRTELNAVETFQPKIPESYKEIKYVFLANLDPELQISVLSGINNPQLVVLDTMNFWIQHKRDKLIEAIKFADILVLNEGEARQLFETPNLVQAANRALALVKRAVIIKKGEHGALLFTRERHFSAPGYPLERVFDPTGCGDSFGGAMTGYLAKTKSHNEMDIRKAVVYGSVIASFTAEDFSINRLINLTHHEIDTRYAELKEIREF